MDKNKNSKHFFKQLRTFETKIDWNHLVDITAHIYVESRIGDLKMPVESLIRIQFLQRQYKLSETQVLEAISEIDMLKAFSLIDETKDDLPKEESITAFSVLIKEKQLAPVFDKTFNAI